MDGDERAQGDQLGDGYRVQRWEEDGGQEGGQMVRGEEEKENGVLA